MQAGATGSYGTVVEPCAYTEKFPNPEKMIGHYLAGESLIEAYWKSVKWPGEGIFIGEPLAKPFTGYTINKSGNDWKLSFPWLVTGTYKLYVKKSATGKELEDQSFTLTKSQPKELTITIQGASIYRLQKIN